MKPELSFDSDEIEKAIVSGTANVEIRTKSGRTITVVPYKDSLALSFSNRGGDTIKETFVFSPTSCRIIYIEE